MAVLLSLLSSVGFGAADFLGGVASRRLRVTVTTLLAHAAGFAVVLPAVLLVPGTVSPAALLWGAGAGLFGAGALLGYYQALATGRMALVAPLAAVLSAAFPVAAGVLLGQSTTPLEAAGMGLGLAAIVAMSLQPRRTAAPGTAARTAIVLGVAAGIGFGLFFVCIDQAPPDSGLWPLAGARMASVVLFALLTATTGGIRQGDRPSLLAALLAGLIDTGATAFFVLATRHGQLGIVAVLASLYPAVTVGLSVSLLGERPRWYQFGGILLALLAVALIALP